MQHWKEGSKGTQYVKATRKEDGYICSNLIHDQSQSVFLITDEDIINQFDLRSHKITKQYYGLEIEDINCLSSFHNLLCVGGDNYHFILINILEKRVLTIDPIKTRIQSIYFFQFTTINQNNHPIAALVVSGGQSLYVYYSISC